MADEAPAPGLYDWRSPRGAMLGRVRAILSEASAGLRQLAAWRRVRAVSRETSLPVRPTAPLASGSEWAPSTRSRTRRAGSARRPPRSTWPRASPPPATRRSSSTSTRRATRPSGSACRASEGPGRLRRPRRATSTRATPCGRTDIERLSILVSTPDLAGATMELPRLAGLRAPPARGAGPAARGLRLHPARLPAVARAADRQRAGRRRARDRAGPDRVLRARRARRACSTRSR